MLFYLSFASDTGFLGAFITDAPDARGAVAQANMLGCNPGGEVVIIPAPYDQTEVEHVILERHTGRLLSRADIDAMDVELYGPGTRGKALREMSEHERKGFDGSGYVRVCEKCNTGEPHEHHS